MGIRMWQIVPLTAGERNLIIAYASVSLFGAVLAVCAVLQLGEGALFLRAPTQYEIWTCIAGAIGAGLALYIAQQHLGHGGWRGWVRAAGGMVMLCFTGSIVTGTMVLPLYGTMFGPFTLTMILAGSPFLAALWLTTLCGAHLLVSVWRAERDSIFTTQRLDPRPGSGRA
jgi:hypothetical protein